MANTDLVNEGLLGAYHDELMNTHLAGGVVFDISAYNLTDGQPTPYADLAAALGTGGANVPEPLRKGGMSVKFIQGTAQSSDNKYVQYRLMADTFSTTESDWQGVDDKPTAGSKNLVKSGGAFDELSLKIGDSAEYNNVAPNVAYPFHFIAGESYIIANTGSINIALLTRLTPTGAKVEDINGSFNYGTEIEFIPVNEAFYIYVYGSSNVSFSIRKKNNLDEKIGRNESEIELLKGSVYEEVPIEVKVTNVDRKVTISKSWGIEEGINICNVDIEDYAGKSIRIIINDAIPAITDNVSILAYSFNKNSVTSSSDYIEPFSKGYQKEVVAIDDTVIVPQNAKHLIIVTAQGSAVGDIPQGISVAWLKDKVKEAEDDITALSTNLNNNYYTKNDVDEKLVTTTPVEVKVTNAGRYLTSTQSWGVNDAMNVCSVDVSNYQGKKLRIVINDEVPATPSTIRVYAFNNGTTSNYLVTPSDYIEPFSDGYRGQVVAIDTIVTIPNDAKHLVISTAQGSAVGDIPEGITLNVVENTLDTIKENIQYDTLQTISLDSCAFNSEREITEYGDLVLASGNGVKRVLGFPVKKGDVVYFKFKNISAYNNKVVYASTYAVRASYNNPCIGELYQHAAPQQNEEITIVYPCNITGYFYVSAMGFKHDSYIPSSNISIKVGRNEALKDTVSFNKDTIYNVDNIVNLYANPSFVGIPLCSHQGTNAGGAIIGSAKAWINAARLGYKWLECDIQFTADNVPVFIHDEPINYRGNKIVDSNGDYVPYVSGGDNNTYVKNITLAQLKTYRWADGSPILTLSEGFGIMSQLGMNCRLEFKAEITNHERLANLITACKLFGVERIIYNCTSTDCYMIFPKLIQSGIYKRGVAAKSFTNETDAENLFKWAAEIGGTYVSIYGNSSYTQDSTFIQTMAKKYNVQLDGEDWASFGKEQIAVGVSDYIAPIKDYYEQTDTVVSNQSVDYANDTEVHTFTLSAQSNVNIVSIVADGIEMAVKIGGIEKYRKTGCTNVALILNAGTYKVYLKGTGIVGSLEVRY